MARPIAKLNPQVVGRTRRLAVQYLREDALVELRKSRGARQSDLAALLGISQPTLSNQEKRPDQKIATLAKYVEALGGELEIYATFPDGERVSLGGTADIVADTSESAPKDLHP